MLRRNQRTRAVSSTSIDNDIIPQFLHSSTTIIKLWIDKQEMPFQHTPQLYIITIRLKKLSTLHLIFSEN